MESIITINEIIQSVSCSACVMIVFFLFYQDGLLIKIDYLTFIYPVYCCNESYHD